jgi:NADH-quinone oxidoreductase subunit M
MSDWPILSIITFLPLVGALGILLLPGKQEFTSRLSKQIALWTSLVTFAVSLVMMRSFDAGLTDFQLVENVTWLKGFNINYVMGVDGISVLFVLLSTFLTPLCILASWASIKDRVREYMIAFLILETMMVGMFCALDLLVFYIFFEGVLLPMFLIIGVWGGPRRVYASFKFFLYTLLGSVLMLVAVISLYVMAETTDMSVLMNFKIDPAVQFWLFLAFFASFAVKVPMWPVHTWLPDAHVEAPTAGSVILAGVLLKMGGYGFLRFSIPLFPDASEFFAPIIYGLSMIAIVYTSLVALAQSDMKKLIAYSSIAHMGFVTIGIFTMTQQGIQGAIFQMLSHGIVSAALFLCVGVVYDRLHSREIGDYGGVVKVMPRYAFVFMVMMLGSVGLPGTSGFIGEFLVLVGAFRVNNTVAFVAATGLILGAAYMLWLYRRVIFGTIHNKAVAAFEDLSWREMAIFAPLILMVFWMGFYPKPFLHIMDVSVGHLIQSYEFALDTSHGIQIGFLGR